MRDDRGVRKVARVQSELGESPMWDARTGLLYFVDITEGKINVLRKEGQVETVHQSSARIGALGLTDSGNLIFTEDACIALFDVASGEGYRRAIALQDQVGSSPRWRDSPPSTRHGADHLGAMSDLCIRIREN